MEAGKSEVSRAGQQPEDLGGYWHCSLSLWAEPLALGGPLLKAFSCWAWPTHIMEAHLLY